MMKSITVFILVLLASRIASMGQTNAVVNALKHDLELTRQAQTNWESVVTALKATENTAITNQVGKLVQLSGDIRQTGTNLYRVVTREGIKVDVTAPRDYRRGPSDTVWAGIFGEVTGVDLAKRLVHIRASRIEDIASQ